MATRVATAALRGFLVHETAVKLDNLRPVDGSATGSVYTQADGRPGSPIPGDPRSTYLPRVHHAQPADLDVITLRGGIPRRGGLPASEGASVAYRVGGEEDTEYRGWDEPTVVLGYRPLEWSSAGVTWEQAAAVTIPSTGNVVVVAHRAGSTVRSWRREAAGRTWSPDTDISASTGYDAVCCCLLSRTERVLAFVGPGLMDAFYSDDEGLSWLPYATQLMTSPLPGGDRFQAIEDRLGNILLITVDSASGDYEQWVSADAGVTFILQDSGNDWAVSHRLVRLADGRILVAYIADTLDQEAKYLVLDDAYESIADVLAANEDIALDGTTTVDSIAAVVDDDGIAYIYLQVEAAFGSETALTRVFRSIDDASSWTEYDTPALYTKRGGGLVGANRDLTHHLLAATASSGEVVLVMTPEYDSGGSPPATDGSLVAVLLGGWSTDEMPGQPLFGRTLRSSWGPGTIANNDGSVWLPTQTLAYQGWDDTASGGPLEVDPVPAGYHRFSTVAAQSWAEYGDNTYEESCTYFGEIAVNGGSSATADHGRLRVARCDGVDEAGVRIGVVSTHIRIRDYQTNNLLVAAIAADMINDFMQFLCVFSDLTTVSVYYKRPSSSVWIAAVENATLTTAAAPPTGIGHILRAGTPQAAVTSVVTVGVIALLFAPNGDQGRVKRGLVAAGNREALIWGKALSPTPYPIRDQVGQFSDSPMARLSAAGGSAHERESFSVPAQFDHGIRNLHPQLSPSPSAYWSSADSGEQLLTWDLGADSRVGHSWAIGLCLMRTNFRTATLEVRTDAGVTTTLGTWDAIVGTGLTFVRSGAIVEPNPTTGATAPRVWKRGELAGGFVIFDPSGAPTARRILWNEGGGWGPGLGARPVLRVELLGGEPASGTVHVIAPSGTLVCNRASPTAYRYVRIRIPTQTTVSAVREIGQVILGSILVPGKQWSRGWSWRYTPNTRVEEDDYGTLWAEARGPVRRELTVSFQDGNDYSAMRRNVDPPYLSASAGTPGLAIHGDVQYQLAGLLGETEGGSLPVVALASVPAGTEMITDPSMMLYGLLTGRVQSNNVQGDEGISELDRVESVTVREQA